MYICVRADVCRCRRECLLNSLRTLVHIVLNHNIKLYMQSLMIVHRNLITSGYSTRK